MVGENGASRPGFAMKDAAELVREWEQAASVAADRAGDRERDGIGDAREWGGTRREACAVG
jgi:hypothetical protein